MTLFASKFGALRMVDAHFLFRLALLQARLSVIEQL
jgi:hypothetical protein